MSNGKPMTMMYETKVAKDYKKYIKALVTRECKKQNFATDLTKFTIVEWTFFFPRTNMDSQNYFKCFCDAITECTDLIWHDDNTTFMRDIDIYYDSENPHVEVDIYYSDKIGIFANTEEYNEFIASNCSNCKKLDKIGQKGGCSVYKAIMESRVHKDIDFKKPRKCNVLAAKK